MAKQPAIMFYKGDWKRDPQLSQCSPATRGIWMDMLCDMHDLGLPTITGTCSQIARMCRATETEVLHAIEELTHTKAADVSQGDGRYSITSRRMARDLKVSSQRSKSASSRYADKPAIAGANSLLNLEYEDEGGTVSASSENIYALYPRKVAKRDALRAIENALRRIRDGENGPKMDVTQAVNFLSMTTSQYATSEAGNNGNYTPHPATWFNQSRYLDDTKEWKSNGGNNGTYAPKARTAGNVDAAKEVLARRQRRRDGGSADEAGLRAPIGN